MTEDPKAPNGTQAARIIWSIVLLGVTLAIAIWVSATAAAGWSPFALAFAGFAISGIALLLAAKPDSGTKWWELGKRRGRTWIGFLLAIISFILAVASLITLFRVLS